MCPICDAATSAPVCERDRTATLLVDLPPDEAPAPAPGMVIAGRYEIERRIGAGGYGQVFAARHRGTGQSVALKILHPPPDGDHAFATKRFFLEARVTSGLSHPNTVRVFDFGQEDSGLLFLAMELLNGRTLRAEQKAREKRGATYSEAEAIEIAIQVTRSLSEAHDAGLVHRDLKPDNIFLHRAAVDDIVVKVLDFGIAKLGGGHATLSSDTSVPGTPAYMAPEHALNRPVDARTDLYSLGVVLFQLVTGELPFVGASDPQTLYMHAFEALPSLAAKSRTQLSPGFQSVLERVLAKDPARRFESARAMRDALAACAEGRADRFIASSVDAPVEQHISHMSTPVAGTGFVPTPRRAARWPLVVGGAALVVSAALVTYVLQRGPVNGGGRVEARARDEGRGAWTAEPARAGAGAADPGAEAANDGADTADRGAGETATDGADTTDRRIGSRGSEMANDGADTTDRRIGSRGSEMANDGAGAASGAASSKPSAPGDGAGARRDGSHSGALGSGADRGGADFGVGSDAPAPRARTNEARPKRTRTKRARRAPPPVEKKKPDPRLEMRLEDLIEETP